MQTQEKIAEGSDGTRKASRDLPGVRLESRRLTTAEAECLHQELKSTPNILGYTVPELLRFADVRVALATDDSGGDETFAGACLVKDLRWDWTEISVVYVLPAFRGRGISSRLFETAFADAQSRRRHVFTLSRSPEVIHLMKRLGMETTGAAWKAPMAVHLEMNWHMMSRYRWSEASRKMKMRKADGYEFLAGMKRFP